MHSVVFSLLFSSWVLAQTPEPRIKSPRFSTVSTKIGLAQDIVTDMLLDNDGFLYIATEGGLDRWDGYQLKRIRGENEQLTDMSISRLFQDSQGSIWISTLYAGMYRLNPQTGAVQHEFTLPLIDDPNFNQSANSFIEVSDSHVFIGLDFHIVRYDYTSGAIEQIYEVPAEHVKNGDGIRWIETIDEQIIIAMSSGLFVRSPTGEVKQVDFLPEDYRDDRDSRNVKHLYKDSLGNLWVSTVRGLYVGTIEAFLDALDQSQPQWNTQTAIASRNVWRVVEYESGKFWIGTDIGLFSLASQPQFNAEYILQPMKGIEVLSRKDILDIEVDRDGNLWLGTNYGGAMYWSPSSLLFDNIQIANDTAEAQVLTDNTVWALSTDTDGQLWIGTDNGLTQFDPTTQQSKLYLQKDEYIPFSDSYIDRIFTIDEQTLILQSGEGLWWFDKETGKRSRPPTQNQEQAEILSDFVWGSGLDVNNNIWFVVNNSFHRYSIQQQIVEPIEIDAPLNPAKFYAFLGYAPEYQNRLWASMVGALMLVNPVDKSVEVVHELDAAEKTRELYPSSLLLDKQNILWVAYPGLGLFGLDGQSFEQKYFFNQNNMLPTTLVYSLIADDDDNLWFSSHSGLHRINSARDRLDNFRYGQELNVAEFNDGAVTRMANGHFVFGSPSGVVSFSPDSVNNRATEERNYSQYTFQQDRMAITEVSLATRQLELPFSNIDNNPINLSHDDNGLSIRFSSLQYSHTNNTSYVYKLLQNGRVLTEAETSEPFVNFALLEPGKYEFVVAPSLNSGGAEIQPARLPIHVAHAPWNTPQARAMYVFMIVAVLFVIWSVRRRQIYHLEQARSQVKLFGDAFKQTSDWVIIFDREFNPIALNPSLEKAFGLNSEEDTLVKFERLKNTYPEFERNAMSGLRHFLREGFWRSEQKLTLADGKEHDVLINLTTVSNDDNSNEADHYLMVFSDISDQKRAERKLRKMATFDGLTGLVNRNLALDRLEHAIENAKSHNTLVAVLFVDLDRFKGINDSLGHEYGDNILKVVAKRMLNIAAQNDTVGRIGGDEFVIVMEDVVDFEDVSSFISQLVALIEEPITVRSEILRVSCSIGVSMYPNDGIEPADLLRFADVAMYSAKNDPVNSFRFFTESMNVRAKYRLSLENLVKRAYQQELFYNVYQPIVNVKTAKTEGMELLLRCAISEQPISPAEFVPILEEMRLIVEVTRSSLGAAMKEVSNWYKQGFNGYLSVNLSALHFTAAFDIQGLDKLLASYNLPKSALRFEVTEGVLMGDREMALEQFDALKAAGYKLALDDFGTGYSSLSYLKMFPLDVIKIDKSFTDDIGKGSSGDSLIITTIGMANNLHMDCIAEGIETEEQVKFLRQQSCVSLQGYYFSKPVTADMSSAIVTRDWAPMLALDPGHQDSCEGS
ncbi:EAL domain-containing protein [Alteromonas sp. ASW11-36]|uniref:EAL domain-containing protein n=1 Tax=Alteromonas arenosi TaxID=3055817 RepID=A0ABT7T3B0_9ALTE|nr:EAL domain-containing protein [Alteromonas sp. ASW11-36]MDM7862244.1 EAL domain-containing protein [Alteromonas sp. ASW11-36]